MVLDFKYILLYWGFFFYMYLYNACSITLEWGIVYWCSMSNVKFCI